MPNVYKLKTCPKCGTEHRKRGEYCSRSCGNHREISSEERSRRSKKFINSGTDAAEKAKWIIAQQNGANKGITEEQIDDGFPVPPWDTGIGPYEIDSDGDLWQ